MKWLSSISLKNKILLSIILLLILLGGVAFFATNQVVRHTEQEKLESLFAHASRFEVAVASNFYQRYMNTKVLATNQILVQKNIPGIIQSFNQFVTGYGVYDLVMLVDPEGRFIASNTLDAQGQKIHFEVLASRNYANEGWFKAAISEQYSEDMEKGLQGVYVEDLSIDAVATEVYSENRIGNSFSTLIRDDKGAALGVLTVKTNIRFIEEEIVAMSKELKQGKLDHVDISLLNKSGVVIADYDPDQKKDLKSELRNYDFSILFKLNLLKKQYTPAVLIKSGSRGSGYFYNTEKRTDQAVAYLKISHPKFFDSLGWGVLIRVNKTDFLSAVTTFQKISFVLFTAFFLIILAIGFIFAQRLSQTLSELADKILSEAKNLSKASEDIAANSTDLSQAATQQAAALQETVGSVDEISAMVKKNAQNANNSKEITLKSQTASQRGTKAVEDVIGSIDDINRSNIEIVHQIEKGNQEIAEIVRVISEIGQKTKVIDDIVFQTKLLSFNASVEAARAGEHGKGFTVVAEEVGNLAQMSGSAAKEISTMLDASLHKVDQIVKNTSTKVEALVAVGKKKIEQGTVTAKNCGQVLDEIYTNVLSSSEAMSEIASASQEQAHGIHEVTQAMVQLDLVTQQNSLTSKKAAVSAEKLNEQAASLNRLVSELMGLIVGHKKRAEVDNDVDFLIPTYKLKTATDSGNT